jgi:ATP-dependent helicase IRC3
MVGRGMRLYEGKKDCHVLDMVASLETGIVTTPTLFGLDPHELVEGADVKQLKAIKSRKEAEKRRADELAAVASSRPPGGADDGRRLTFTDYDSLQDLIGDTSSEGHIRGMSQLAWVQISPVKYILSTTGDHIRIEQLSEQEFDVKLTVKLPKAIWQDHRKTVKSPYMRPRLLAKTLSLEDAVHAADTYACEKYPYALIAKNQRWRMNPASNEQLAMLNRMRPADDQLTAGQLTKGRAGDMITKIRHGAAR